MAINILNSFLTNFICNFLYNQKKCSISIAEYSLQVSIITNRTSLSCLVFYLPIYIPVYYSLTLQFNLIGEYNQTVLYCITIHFILYAILFTTLLHES